MSLPALFKIQSFSFFVALLALAACGPGGSAPELQSVTDRLVAVNQELVIVLLASDEDGDEVFYSFESDVPDIYSRASLNRLPVGVGEFRWTPGASDVGEWFFDFTASDGGRSDTVTIRIEVRAAVGGNSAPRFVHPQGSGTTLDLSVNDCLPLNVEVVDADSADVVIGQAEPLIEGATVEALSGLTAAWNWCPSEQQIAADDRYTLLLTADDSDNPKTLHPYLIVLRSPQKPDCPGDAPIVTHAPQDVQSLTNLTIVAGITDDLGLKQEPLLYYSTTEPSDPPDLSSMVQVTMEPGSGGLGSTSWSASVPNPVVGQAPGASADLYYLIVADDDDDTMGNCDHLTRAPTTGSYRMTVTNPGGAGGAGVCEACTADLQCGGGDDHCVRVGASADSFCLQDCSVPCPTDYECSTTALESVDGAISRHCVPVSLDCSNPGGLQCADDSFENNDSRLSAQANAVLPADTTHNLVSCPAASGVGDDEDWFEVFLSEESTLDVTLSGTGVSDLDLAIYQQDGSFIASSGSLSSQEAVSHCLPQGFYVIRVYAFGAQENPYTLSYTTTPQICNLVASCQPDASEDDDNATQARVVDIAAGVFQSTGQTLCSLDQDWYEVQLLNDQLLLIELSFDQTANSEDLDIHLYNSASVDLTPCSAADTQSCDGTNGQGATSNESLIFVAPASGCAPCTFYVVVEGFDGAENDYDIRIEGG